MYPLSAGGLWLAVITTAAAAPVRRARVTLRSTEDGSALVSVTDDEGRFVFRELPAGRYTITVSKPGYVNLPYGAESHRGQPLPIALEDGQVVSGLVARLTRGAVLAGRVLDARGQPFNGAFLSLAERRIVNGQPTLIREDVELMIRWVDRLWAYLVERDNLGPGDNRTRAKQMIDQARAHYVEKLAKAR